MKRILLQKLVLSGLSKKDAILEFKQGLNIITGDSDTGKTYAFQCINYILGGSTVPKSINEAEGYSFIRLDFSVEKEQYQLIRKIGDSKITISHNGEIMEVPYKHDSTNKNNLSRFLLSVISESDDLPQLRQNKQGKKRSLSFRDLVHICLVGETDILLEQSAFDTSNYSEKTVRKSVLKYVVTGEDDRKVLAAEKTADENLRRAGVVQFLQTKEKELVEKIEKIENDDSYKLYDSSASTAKIIRIVSSVREDIARISEEIGQKEKEIHDLRRLCASDEAQIESFINLLKHYKADLSEIEGVSSFSDFMLQLPELACPVCGQHFCDTLLHTEKSEELFRYYKKEQEVLSSQICDLEQTIDEIRIRLAENKRILDSRKKEKREQEETVSSLQKRIKRYNKIIATQRQMDALQKTLDIYREELISVKADIIRYSEKLSEVKTLAGNSSVLLYNSYCSLVKQILINWGFDEKIEVSFDPETLDLIIDEKSRTSWGKGYRAFIMAAMTIGLMRYCFDNDKLHPGFVVLDSPLVSLKERKQEESGTWVSDYMEKRMIEDIDSNDEIHQVIIFENKELNYCKTGNYLEFRHEGDYRRGFIE